MISVIPQSITATSQVFTADLTERLCKPYCVLSSIQPSVNVVYTIDDTNLVGTDLYVTVKALMCLRVAILVAPHKRCSLSISRLLLQVQPLLLRLRLRKQMVL